MALMQQNGGGMSLAMEEKILNIENNVIDIKEKITKLMAKIDSLGTIGFAGGAGGHGGSSDHGASRLVVCVCVCLCVCMCVFV